MATSYPKMIPDTILIMNLEDAVILAHKISMMDQEQKTVVTLDTSSWEMIPNTDLIMDL